MTEAYSDLTSHQMGMVAGMRSAMEDMIHRFDPAKIEAESTAKGVLSRISRAHGRSDYWDAYCARYQGIADALGNDFQDFYAQAFIRAYEEEIAGCAKVASST
jgi:FHA domain-containing protein